MTPTAPAKDKTHNGASESCFRLIYRSRSLLPPTATPADNAGLADVLRVSRKNNAALGITGALMLYDDWFAQVLEGPKDSVEKLFERIRVDPRHTAVSLDQVDTVPKRLFTNWAMAIVAEHHQPDSPLVATKGGLAEGSTWKVSLEQEVVLTRLRDLTRGYGRGS